MKKIASILTFILAVAVLANGTAANYAPNHSNGTVLVADSEGHGGGKGHRGDSEGHGGGKGHREDTTVFAA